MTDTPPLIAHVIVRLDVGGLENGIVNLVNRIPSSRYRQAIICLTEYTDFRKRIDSPDVPVIALHKKPGKDLAVYWHLWRTLRGLRPRFVHTRNLGTVDAVIPAVLAGVPFRIHGEHGWDVSDLHGTNTRYRRLRRVCARFIHRHVTVSKDLADWLSQQVGVPRNSITHICNGVDTEKFEPPAEGRVRLNGPDFGGEDCLVIGMVGRMAEVKNPMTLARAFIRLVTEDAETRRRLRLVIVGAGPLRQAVMDALVEAGVSELTWVPGERDDIQSVLAGLDVFVMPSLNEGISNTILEAMATGRAIVATDVGGNPELVVDEETGFLVAPA
ncbi:MAG: TIGR03088 family PEP-CTERM/XrtA system glycosyltransferase, partial [Gammaproteobacteria bacterium]